MNEAIDVMVKMEKRDLERAVGRAMQLIEEGNYTSAATYLMQASEHKYALSMMEVIKEQEA